MVPIGNHQNADVSVFHIPPFLPPWQIGESLEYMLLLLFPEAGPGPGSTIAECIEIVDFGVSFAFKSPLYHLLSVWLWKN